ncbi:MAG TPA: hypothetical protein VLA09_07105, partial [Longimicrobiales bacterium]|nr:hypothetical protein [Longimicrobiales bacterium]
ITVGIYAMSLYAAPVVVALWLGAEVLSGATRQNRADRVKKFLVGGPIVAFAILLPWIGWIARLAATLLGVGALLKALYATSSGLSGSSGGRESR